MFPCILRLRDVKERTGLSRSTIYELMATGEFPKQVQLTLRSVGWSEDEVHDWILARLEKARKGVS